MRALPKPPPSPASKTPPKKSLYQREGALLAKLLKSRGDKTSLAERVATVSGTKCSYGVVHNWTKGISFTKRNQRYVVEILGLADDYFSGQPAGAAQSSTRRSESDFKYPSLKTFVETSEEALTDDEVSWLASHRMANIVGDPGYVWWLAELRNYRLLRRGFYGAEPAPAGRSA